MISLSGGGIILLSLNMMEGYMNRRSFFVFAAVFMMILMAFSFALASDTVAVENDDNSLSAGLYGGSTLSDKMTGTHSKDGEWDIFTFTINKPLADSDWKTDENYTGGLFDIWVEIKAPDNATGCIRYFPDKNTGNNADIEEGYVRLQNAVPKGEHIGSRSFEYRLEWINNSSGVISTTNLKAKCVIIDDSAPKPIPKDRIIAGMDGALKRDGFVLYPNAENVSTQITAPEGAAYYSLNNSTTKTAVTDGKAVVAADANAAYTISWYADENSTSPIKAETLSVSFYYEPVPVSWLNIGFSNKWETVVTKVPQDGEADINYVNGDLVFEFNLTDEQWQELLYNSVDSQYLHWPFEIKLPGGAKKLSNVGTYYKNEEGIDFIFVANYFESYGRIGWPIEIANISTDGSKAIVTPKNFEGTYLFKWKDTNGVEHFHQINFQIKHDSEAAVVVDSVEPGKSRIKLNVDELENVDREYQDGVVTYSIKEEPDPNAFIRTTVERPNANAAKVMVINTMNGQKWVQKFGEGNTAAILDIPAGEGKEGMITYKLEWLNSDGDEWMASPDLITIKVLPIYAGAWMEKYWAPVENTGLVEDNGLSEHLTYKNGGWTFEVDPASKNTLDVERLSTNERLIYILVPENAKYFRMTSGESSLYWYDGADGDKEFLEGGKLIPIEDAENETSMKLVEINGQRALAAHFGSIFTKSSFKNDNLDVYVVNEDVTGHGTYRIIEWFDESEKQIYFGEKRGQYIYMEKKPYMQTAETELGFDNIYASITPNPGEAYAIVWDCQPDKVGELQSRMFRCEVPLQKDTHGNHRYVYQKLDLIDADGNVVELPEGTTIKVVLPYPEGLNKDNTKLEHFDVWHYEDESHSKHESMRKNGSLALEDIGITFITDSFSPFLLSYEPTSNGNSSGSGISVTYNGGNSFSTSNSAVPTSVEIDGVPVSFTGDGRSFTVSGIPAGAKWITVRWNSTSITTNFAPDGNVVSAGIEIPKTGDISLLMPVLALIGAAAARCRRSSK